MQQRREKRFKPVLRLDSSLRRRLAKKIRFDNRGHSFELPEWYIALLYRCTHCFYTGKKFGRSGNNKLTLERVDNNKGYVVGNVIPVCAEANAAKSCLSDTEIVDVIEELESKIESSMNAIENYFKAEDKYESYLREFVDHPYSFNKDKAILSTKRLCNTRKSINDTENSILCKRNKIKILNQVLTASSYYSKMSHQGIIMCLMYQQGFVPEERFKVNI